MDEWAARIEVPGYKRTFSWMPTQAPSSLLMSGWAHYQEVRDQQQELLRSTKDLTILIKALARFTRLSCIETYCPPVVEVQRAPKSIREIYSQCFLRPVPHPTHVGHNQESYGPPGVRPLRSLLTAAACAGTKLKSLSARNVDCTFFARESWCFHIYKQSIENLQYIHIKMEFQAGHPVDMTQFVKDTYAAGLMREFLSAAKNLKLIELEFSWTESEDVPQYVANFDAIIGGGHVWPQLQNVSLGGMNIQRTPFFKFLEIHKSTLNTVSLGSIRWSH
ncbi:hypothetical protein MMC13_007197 [Lambiella insularis]|nr:hypothetical protein [Lambiella insularis]